MTSYHPTARRPIANMFRRTAHGAVRICTKLGIPADFISYSSIVTSAAAGVSFALAGSRPWLLIVAVLLCYLRLWLNMLDGMVALASGTASKRGELLNELPDRLSDALIFAGVAHSGLSAPAGAYWAAIASLLTAYVGMFGQALGGRRQFGGLMAKPWRLVALNVGAWGTLALIWNSGQISYFGWTVLDWTHLAIVLGCVQSIWIRLAGTLKDLGAVAVGGADV